MFFSEGLEASLQSAPQSPGLHLQRCVFRACSQPEGVAKLLPPPHPPHINTRPSASPDLPSRRSRRRVSFGKRRHRTSLPSQCRNSCLFHWLSFTLALFAQKGEKLCDGTVDAVTLGIVSSPLQRDASSLCFLRHQRFCADFVHVHPLHSAGDAPACASSLCHLCENKRFFFCAQIMGAFLSCQCVDAGKDEPGLEVLAAPPCVSSKSCVLLRSREFLNSPSLCAYRGCVRAPAERGGKKSFFVRQGLPPTKPRASRECNIAPLHFCIPETSFDS